MTETNGHAPADLVGDQLAGADELEALLQGAFEPVQFEFAPGRWLEIRPLLMGAADRLYEGGLSGAGLQRFLMAHCVYTAGRPIGNEGVDRLPVALATKLVPIVMQANGMVWTAPDSDAAADGTADPKA